MASGLPALPKIGSTSIGSSTGMPNLPRVGGTLPGLSSSLPSIGAPSSGNSFYSSQLSGLSQPKAAQQNQSPSLGDNLKSVLASAVSNFGDVASGVVETLARPNQAIMHFFQSTLQGDPIATALHNAGAAFLDTSGKSDINARAELGLDPNKGGLLAGIPDFALTALQDPLTYVTAGAGKLGEVGLKAIGTALGDDTARLVAKVGINGLDDATKTSVTDVLRAAPDALKGTDAAKWADQVSSTLANGSGLRFMGKAIIPQKAFAPVTDALRLTNRLDPTGNIVTRSVGTMLSNSRGANLLKYTFQPIQKLKETMGLHAAENAKGMVSGAVANLGAAQQQIVDRGLYLLDKSGLDSDELATKVRTAFETGNAAKLAQDYAAAGRQGAADLVSYLDRMDKETQAILSTHLGLTPQDIAARSGADLSRVPTQAAHDWIATHPEQASRAGVTAGDLTHTVKETQGIMTRRTYNPHDPIDLVNKHMFEETGVEKFYHDNPVVPILTRRAQAEAAAIHGGLIQDLHAQKFADGSRYVESLPEHLLNSSFAAREAQHAADLKASRVVSNEELRAGMQAPRAETGAVKAALPNIHNQINDHHNQIVQLGKAIDRAGTSKDKAELIALKKQLTNRLAGLEREATGAVTTTGRQVARLAPNELRTQLRDQRVVVETLKEKFANSKQALKDAREAFKSSTPKSEERKAATAQLKTAKQARQDLQKQLKQEGTKLRDIRKGAAQAKPAASSVADRVKIQKLGVRASFNSARVSMGAQIRDLGQTIARATEQGTAITGTVAAQQKAELGQTISEAQKLLSSSLSKLDKYQKQELRAKIQDARAAILKADFQAQKAGFTAERKAFEEDMSRRGYVPLNTEKGRLGAHYAPAALADQLGAVSKLASGQDEAVKSWSKVFHGFGKFWRAYAIFGPAFHERTALGHTFNMWQEGFRDPREFGHAFNMMKVLLSSSKHFDTLEEAINASKLSEQDKAIFRAASKMGVAHTGFLRHDVNVGRQIEDVYRSTPQKIMGKLNPLDINHNIAVGTNVKVMRMLEDMRRLAMFSERAKALGSYRGAADAVKRALFDYSELTPAEQKIKQLIPFYTYARKNMMFQLQSLLKSPGKISAINNVRQQLIANVNPQTTNIPASQLPLGAIPITSGDNPLVINMSRLPFYEAVQQVAPLWMLISQAAGLPHVDNGTQEAMRLMAEHVGGTFAPLSYMYGRASGFSPSTGMPMQPGAGAALSDVLPFAQRLSAAQAAARGSDAQKLLYALKNIAGLTVTQGTASNAQPLTQEKLAGILRAQAAAAAGKPKKAATTKGASGLKKLGGVVKSAKPGSIFKKTTARKPLSAQAKTAAAQKRKATLASRPKLKAAVVKVRLPKPKA